MRQLARHGGVERQLHRANRQARRLGVFAFTTKVGRKRLAHRIAKALFYRVEYAAGRGHTPAKHHLHAHARGKAAVARQRCVVERVFFSRFVQAQRLEHFGALHALDQPHRNAFAHAVGHAPHIALHTGQRGRAAQLQHKKLLFIDGLVGARANVFYKGPTTIELIAARAFQ